MNEMCVKPLFIAIYFSDNFYRTSFSIVPRFRNGLGHFCFKNCMLFNNLHSSTEKAGIFLSLIGIPVILQKGLFRDILKEKDNIHTIGK